MSDWIYGLLLVLLLAHGYIRLADVQLRSWAPLTLRRVLKRGRRPDQPAHHMGVGRIRDAGSRDNIIMTTCIQSTTHSVCNSQGDVVSSETGVVPKTGVECPSWCAGLHSPAETAVLGRICDRVVSSRDGVIVALALDPATATEPVVALMAPDLDAHIAMPADTARQMATVLELGIRSEDAWLSASVRSALALLEQG